MPSQQHHPDPTPVVRNVWSLANCHHWQRCGRLGNTDPLPATRRVSVPAGEMDSSQGGRSVASTIQGQNSTPTSSLNDSDFAHITQHVTSTPSTTQRQSINTPTPTLGTSNRNTSAPGWMSQTDWTCCAVSGPAPGIAGTPTSLSGLENLPYTIPNPEARTIITNPLRTRATEQHQRQRMWPL